MTQNKKFFFFELKKHRLFYKLLLFGRTVYMMTILRKEKEQKIVLTVAV